MSESPPKRDPAPRRVKETGRSFRWPQLGGPGTFAITGIALTLVTGFGLFYIGADSNRFGALRPAVALPLLLLVGVGSLLILITGVVAVLDRYGLTDRGHAFGLPDGTIQAVIAISLVLIFVIASLFLYSSLPTGFEETAGDPDTLQNRREIAQQLLTTVGTLAVAVAGFYFGTRSVETARAAVATSGEALAIVWPASPHEMAADEAVLEPIVLEPRSRRIKGTIQGDPAGQLTEIALGTFRYQRGSSAEETVKLVFTLGRDEPQELRIDTKKQD